ncbi:HlyD family efflux transporter periplasmic adaptor subunit, partial [bacterium]|nr:HlyD family efflux transporter periplasmic adaptor subunit [bacterium]
DPRLFKAGVDRDNATLSTREADLERVEAQLQQSLNNYLRGKRLRGTNKDFMSDREMDALVFDVKSLQAQRKLARASILQAKASLETSEANLKYCEVTSPVDGVVINRLINPGQTLAAQFQTPELFVVAPDLREKVHVFASVDEADIGLIQAAKKTVRKAFHSDRAGVHRRQTHDAATIRSTDKQHRKTQTICCADQRLLG